MHDFSHASVTLSFPILTGKVLDATKRSQTPANADGAIDHSTVSPHPLWVLDDEGCEHPINLSGRDIPVYAGQQVSIVAVTSSGPGDLLHSVLVNHSAGKHWFLNKGLQLCKHFALWRYRLKPPVLGALGYVAFETLTALGDLALLMAGSFAAYNLWNDRREGQQVIKELNRHLEELAQQTYVQERARQVALARQADAARQFLALEAPAN